MKAMKRAVRVAFRGNVSKMLDDLSKGFGLAPPHLSPSPPLFSSPVTWRGSSSRIRQWILRGAGIQVRMGLTLAPRLYPLSPPPSPPAAVLSLQSYGTGFGSTQRTYSLRPSFLLLGLEILHGYRPHNQENLSVCFRAVRLFHECVFLVNLTFVFHTI